MTKTSLINLKVLNVLMTSDNFISTKELCNLIECDRKAIYKAIADLETTGFGIEIIQEHSKANRYKYSGKIYGF